MRGIAVIAIGGNSLTLPGEPDTFEQRQKNARIACESIANVIELGYRVVVTHGNGPQVGAALLRSELSQPDLALRRLDECDAETEGEIGYVLQQTLTNVLLHRRIKTTVASLVTQVVVSAEDAAFHNPTKPIGPFYRTEEALERSHKLNWTMTEDSGRGWRRLVPSPKPLEIVELPAIESCLRAGMVVIAAGGGGIPVVRTPAGLRGVDAVIDKDRASALLARKLQASLLLFSTAVDRVALHFGRPDALALDSIPFIAAQEALAEGEFPPGSMGPKIEAALEFLQMGGELAIITSPENIAAAVEGRAGTRILPPLRAALPGRAVA